MTNTLCLQKETNVSARVKKRKKERKKPVFRAEEYYRGQWYRENVRGKNKKLYSEKLYF